MQKDQLLTEKQKTLLTKEGFIARYYENCNFSSTIEAYEATERQLVAITGQRRYKNWESFKMVKNKYIKTLKKGNKVTTCDEI